ncbi:MAG: hypothetical protein QXN59_03320 [Candidatus Micrarchaeaceae archaeon]
MGIEDAVCSVCGKQLDTEDYYYIYTGRLQQGVESGAGTNKEYIMCRNCYVQINAELLSAIRRKSEKG